MSVSESNVRAGASSARDDQAVETLVPGRRANYSFALFSPAPQWSVARAVAGHVRCLDEESGLS